MASNRILRKDKQAGGTPARIRIPITRNITVAAAALYDLRGKVGGPLHNTMRQSRTVFRAAGQLFGHCGSMRITTQCDCCCALLRIAAPHLLAMAHKEIEANPVNAKGPRCLVLHFSLLTHVSVAFLASPKDKRPPPQLQEAPRSNLRCSTAWLPPPDLEWLRPNGSRILSARSLAKRGAFNFKPSEKPRQCLTQNMGWDP